MARKQMAWKVKGMNRDLSVSVFSPEFAFQNRNIRFSTEGNNTIMSCVNERGTKKLSLSIDASAINNDSSRVDTTIWGIPIGTAVINTTLVVFTTDTYGNPPDYIYKFEYSQNDSEKNTLQGKLLYNGNLGFSSRYPIETLVSYENENIQKVYWTDGKNQPRMINIASDNILAGSGPNAVKDADTQFDFVGKLQLNETVTVKKILGAEGMFPPGVIQYAFTYYKNHGQETNIFYTTPLYYISYKDRGASPEDTRVENAFEITIEDIDTNYDYLRIYSIQRTSLDGTPIVKRVRDIDISLVTGEKSSLNRYSTDNFPIASNNGKKVGNSGYFSADTQISSSRQWYYYSKKDYPNLRLSVNNGYITWGKNASEDSILCVSLDKFIATGSSTPHYHIVELLNNHIDYMTEEPMYYVYKGKTGSGIAKFTDTGDTGDTIDPTELLYIGGETVSIGTMSQKDNTLFMGNINITRQNVQTLGIDSTWFQNPVNLSDSYVVGCDTRTIYFDLTSKNSYTYGNQLNSYTSSNKKQSIPCAGFKRGDYYRLGIQFQHETGRWSDPVYIDDVPMTKYPQFETVDGNYLYSNLSLPVFSTQLKEGKASELTNMGYVKMRGVVVFPRMQDRMVVCQGVVCPTVFTRNHRDVDKDLYAQASWFFRCNEKTSLDEMLMQGFVGTVPPLRPTKDNSGHSYLRYMPCSIGGAYAANFLRQTEIQGYFDPDNRFQTDNMFVTLNSPDIEFNTETHVLDLSLMHCKQVGKTKFSATLSDIDIQTETPTIANTAGFVHKSFNSNNDYGIISGLFYEDFIVKDTNSDFNSTQLQQMEGQKSACKWMVYTWNKSGSLNNDITRPASKGVQSAILKKKIISNLRVSNTTVWDINAATNKLSGIGMYSSDQPIIEKIGAQGSIYRGNIDSILLPDDVDGMYFASSEDMSVSNMEPSFTSKIESKTYSDNDEYSGIWKRVIENGIEKWKSVAYKGGVGPWYKEGNVIAQCFKSLTVKKDPVRMKYKSTPHIAMSLSSALNWDDEYLPVAEICKSSMPSQIFGGITKDALMENVWLPCGEPVNIEDNAIIEYSYGDTYYQRWDCLKTYPYTQEDENQIVEIGSFMLETRVNIDGRYDKNRGQLNNLNMSPVNFNLLNTVYSQTNNFFNYRIQNEEYYENSRFSNVVTWSKTKSAGADVDLWTNVTLASTLDIDGDKGEVRAIKRFNDQLIIFQDTGVSQILYNENTLMSTTEGVPVEIGNSGKVNGKRYISTSIGCSNKWSITTTPMGIYFLDSSNRHIWRFNGKIENLSLNLGMDTWAKDHITGMSVIWNPYDFYGFVSYYDSVNQDVLFINSETALAYSEKFQTFTSFYDYGNAPYLCGLDSTGIWLMPEKFKYEEDGKALEKIVCGVYKHNAGEYCKFFNGNVLSPYSMTLVGNPEPLIDKTFTNIEFRACVDKEGTEEQEDLKEFYLPFDFLEVWNEYQHGYAYLKNLTGYSAAKHFDGSSNMLNANSSSLRRKFRIWRCDIPRDNASLESDSTMSISRIARHPNNRMRNPWLYIKLTKETNTDKRMEVFDMIMTYFT